jgi:hypothetical protein
MEEKYNEMLSALSAGVVNLNNVPTMEEMTASLGGLASDKNVGFLMFQSLAIMDAVSGLNQLNQFLNVEKIPIDGEMKASIVKSLQSLTLNQGENIQQLNYIAKNMVGTRLGQVPFRLDSIIEGVLDDIIKAGRMLAKNA